MRSPFRSTVAGSDPRVTARYVALALALLPVVYVGYELYLHRTLGGVVFFPSPLTVLVVGGASLAAYHTRSAVGAAAFGLFPTLGFELFAASGIPTRPLAAQLAVAATSPTLGVGLVFAGFGWAFGMTTRRLVVSMSPPTDPA